MCVPSNLLSSHVTMPACVVGAVSLVTIVGKFMIGPTPYSAVVLLQNSDVPSWVKNCSPCIWSCASSPVKKIGCTLGVASTGPPPDTTTGTFGCAASANGGGESGFAASGASLMLSP